MTASAADVDISTLERLHSASTNQLMGEYRRTWAHRGFSYSAFLRWRCTPRAVATRLLGVPRRIGPSAILNPLQCAQLEIAEESSAAMINPDWADLWAEHFPSVKSAAEWAREEFSASEAAAMKRIGYRAPKRAKMLNTILRDKGWLVVMESRTDIKIPTHPDLNDWFGPTAEAAETITALVLNPDFRFNADQVNTIRGLFVKGGYDPEHAISGCNMVARFCDQLVSRGWPIPDGGGFSTIVNLARRWSPRNVSPAEMMISQSSDDYDLFLTILEAATRIEEGTSRTFLLDDLVKVVYSLNTGVPVDWVDDNMVISILDGGVPGSGWTEVEHHRPSVKELYSTTDLSDRVTAEAARLTKGLPI